MENSSFVDPASVIGRLAIAPGAIVADFGCGAGYFSLEVAKRIGSDGMVYALDVLPSALEAVESRIKTLNLNNVVTKRVNLENEQGSGLTSSSLDWAILKDVLFQNKKKDVMLREVARVLKPTGKALIMEWNPDESLMGPEKKLRVSKEELEKLIAAVGLVVEDSLEIGGFHYAFVVKHSSLT